MLWFGLYIYRIIVLILVKSQHQRISEELVQYIAMETLNETSYIILHYGGKIIEIHKMSDILLLFPHYMLFRSLWACVTRENPAFVDFRSTFV